MLSLVAMRLRNEELKKESKAQAEVSEVSEGDLVEAFGITKDKMARATEIITKDESTKKSGPLSA